MSESKAFTDKTYGEHWASFYRDPVLGVPPPDQTVTFLQRLINSPRSMLDLGCGDGALTIAMASQGIQVTAVDTSSAMLEQLARNDPDGTVKVLQESTLDVAFDAQFDLVTLLGLSLLQLPDQEAQVRALEVASEALAPGGVLVVEGLNPDLGRYTMSQEMLVVQVSTERSILRPATISLRDQVIRSTTMIFDHAEEPAHEPASMTVLPGQIRYIWKSELDLGARLVGLSPINCWANRQFVRYSGAPGVFISAFCKPHVDRPPEG